MPYGLAKDAGGDSLMNDTKMEHCVKKVMNDDPSLSKESAIRICKKSIQDSHRRKKKT